MSNEVDSFLYHGAPNPFKQEFLNQIPMGTGTLKQDFDESYDRPNIDYFTLMDSGYVRGQKMWGVVE